MLVLNDNIWQSDHILKVSGSTRWGSPDSPVLTQCVLDQVKASLQEATRTGKGAILLIDLSQGEFPPWWQALKIAKFFVSMKNLILSGLICTVIYTTTEHQRTWIDRIFMLYSPARPVHIVKTKKAVREHIARSRERRTLSKCGLVSSQ